MKTSASAQKTPKRFQTAEISSNRWDRWGRRTFLAAAAASVPVLGREYGPSAQPVRYPDPDIVVLDPRFARYKLGNTPIQRLYTGNPLGGGACVERSGTLPGLERHSQQPPTALAGRGRTCERVPLPLGKQQREHVRLPGAPDLLRARPPGVSCATSRDGTATVLAGEWEGKPLNAPNDAVVHPDDGAIWFTDPGYGSLMNYEGHKGTLHIKEAVYRIDATSGRMDKVTDEIFKPNGICFSPDYKKLYVADTGASHYPEAPKNIKVWDIVDGERLSGGREFTSMELNGKAGFADGIRADVDGNIWASAGWVGDGYDGVHIFAPDGERIGQIRLPEICGNVCFGGRKRNRLFMTASQSLYAVYVETQGAHIS